MLWDLTEKETQDILHRKWYTLCHFKARTMILLWDAQSWVTGGVGDTLAEGFKLSFLQAKDNMGQSGPRVLLILGLGSVLGVVTLKVASQKITCVFRVLSQTPWCTGANDFMISHERIPRWPSTDREVLSIPAQGALAETPDLKESKLSFCKPRLWVSRDQEKRSHPK